MPYRIQYTLAVIVLLLLVVFGVIQSTGGEALGLTAHQMAWIGVLTAALGTVQSLLPKVHRPPSDERKGMD